MGVELDEYAYKFVPFVPALKLGVFGLQNADAISAQLEALVRRHAVGGWEYVRLEQVSVVHAAGCLASLFGKSNHTMDYDLVVFRIPHAALEASASAEGTATSSSSAGLSSHQAYAPGRPVPDAVKVRYSAAKNLYAVWAELVGGNEMFVDEDEAVAARNEFLHALREVGDLCAEAEVGVGIAVARKAERDFSALLGDSEFVIVIEYLEAHA